LSCLDLIDFYGGIIGNILSHLRKIKINHSLTNLMNASSASFGSLVGGSLIEIFNLVSGLKTFPAISAFGRPSAPTIAS
jgi:hypothetical protein